MRSNKYERHKDLERGIGNDGRYLTSITFENQEGHELNATSSNNDGKGSLLQYVASCDENCAVKKSMPVKNNKIAGHGIGDVCMVNISKM